MLASVALNAAYNSVNIFLLVAANIKGGAKGEEMSFKRQKFLRVVSLAGSSAC